MSKSLLGHFQCTTIFNEKSIWGHVHYKTIIKKQFGAFSVYNNFQGDISWPDAAGEAATLSGGSDDLQLQIANCKWGWFAYQFAKWKENKNIKL